MKKYAFICSLLLSATCFAQLNIVPMPAEINMGEGVFTVDKNTIIYYTGNSIKNICIQFNNSLQKKYGFALPLKYLPLNKIQKNKYKSINFSLFPKLVKEDAAIGAYTIKVDKSNVDIVSMEEEGLFYSMQTLLQLILSPKDNGKQKNYPLYINQLSIKDFPRFKYRGMHLDVSRHFFPVTFIKKYIDYLATYKYNTFHWHLTDDQGWRIEIKKYPLLTKVGGFRNGTIVGRYPGKGNDSLQHGGYYTKEQVKEIVAYAAEKYITVIPEIEMPGHASAAIAAYPQLSCFPNESTSIGKTPWAGSKKGKQVQQTWGVFEDVFSPTDYTFNFLQDVLDEVMPLFPSKYIHIGGDECPKAAWKKSAFCQQLIKDKNLKDEHGLQSYFIQRIEKYLNSRGKNIIGWDEILEGGLAPNATVMSWRGEAGGIEAARQSHDVIMTPGKPVYFDYSQSENEDSVTIGGYNSLEAVYNYEPIPEVLNAAQAQYVLGAQANVWTEYMNNSAKAEYMIFPRMIALSEVLWCPKEKRNWNNFEKRLPVIFERLDAAKINYSRAYFDLKATVLPIENGEGIKWKLESKIKNARAAIWLPGTFWPKGNISKEDSTKITGLVKSTSSFFYNSPFQINYSGLYRATLEDSTDFTYLTLSQIEQKFFLNKATGKKITLINQPHKSYPGDGAFTLVNGIQNEKGLERSNEFLGFLGTDLYAIIDLGEKMKIKEVRLHTFEKQNNWIYHPQQDGITVMISNDGINFIVPEDEVKTVEPDANGVSEIWLSASRSYVKTRYIKIIAKNIGVIPVDKHGAGEKAWLFVDEIEVE
jgi:hexosaminidase